MLYFRHRTLIVLSGFVWLAVGVMLLSMGIRFLLGSLFGLYPDQGGFSLVSSLTASGVSPEVIALSLLSTCLFIGYLKGKMVLSKSVRRQVERILKKPSPVPLHEIYGRGYYFLLGGMILLGVSMRFLPITYDTRGAIDIAIGAALINGALQYFRASLQPRKES